MHLSYARCAFIRTLEILHSGVYGEGARAVIKVLYRVLDVYRGRLKR